MRYLIMTALALPSLAHVGTAFGAAAPSPPGTYLLDGRELMETRRRALAGDPALTEGLRELRRRADRYLQGELWTVTSKPFAGPSGDKRDYLSLAPYFWPDPNSPNGLPYVSRDGEVNPEVRQYDRARLDGMSDTVYHLALAHYLTGEERCAGRAVAQLRVWFLDEATRMNPHLRYAQFVRGKNDGNSFGLIETERLTRVVDGAALLRAAGVWPAAEDRRLREWFGEYLTWLQTSDLGRREDRAPNNHGVLYDVQTTVFALYAGRREVGREILEKAKTRRIATQIEPDGTQPRELARTLSWHYSLLNLTGMCQLAHLGEHAGVDLWHYQTPDGRGIRKALDYMLPYALGRKWEHKQIKAPDYPRLVWVLRRAASAYQEPAYEQAIARLPGMERERAWVDLLWPAGPKSAP